MMFNPEPDLDYFDLDTDDSEMDSDSVMKEIQYLYNEPKVGLIDAAANLPDRHVTLTMPQNKMTVLLVGNHTIGKQKFLALYFSESREINRGGFVQRINYEKLNKIYITHGMQRRLLMGESVLDYCPHLATLKNVPGLKDYLTTEIATKNAKSFVSFILAPEESQMIGNAEDESLLENENSSSIFSTSTQSKKTLDVSDAISKLTEASDLIFVFFDPTGNVPAKNTLKPFERVWEKHHEKIVLLLARTNEDNVSEETREEVVGDIVREIWRNPTVRKIGYLPEIYCPDLSSGIRDDERLWSVIQATAEQSVEKALMQLERDAIYLKDTYEQIRKQNARAMNSQLNENCLSCSMVALTIIGMIYAIWANDFEDVSCKFNGHDFTNLCKDVMGFKTAFCALSLITVLGVCFLSFTSKPQRILTEEELDSLTKCIDFANHAILRKERMANLYTGMKFN